MSDDVRHMCPRRSTVPWVNQGPDIWKRNRWSATQQEADAKVAESMARLGPNTTLITDGDHWTFDVPIPRSCSYCGGIHPDDAIVLLKAGWRVDPTDKAYKRYLEPPEGQRLNGPPVKLYTMHFSNDQREAFNAALKPGNLFHD